MDQYLTIRQIRQMLTNTIQSLDHPELLLQLQQIDQLLECFLDRGIDFKEIVDGLDDSIFITDSTGKVLYVNPAYTANTGIAPEDVLYRNISELRGEGRLYTGGAIPDVLKTGKSAFRLSTTYKDGKALTGYVSGTPIFNTNGELHQVVACSRPIMSLSALKSDFTSFIKELQRIETKNVSDSGVSLSQNMIGKDSSLKPVWSIIQQIAPTDATVLITGESGVGKEVIADEIYKNSLRNTKPFIKINCAAIPAQLLESELFGYEKGAFSGANTKGKPGLFELANNGTLMLDEIGDMPIDLQVKLLRAIQSREITRIGGSQPIKLDIRILALTNCNLKEKIKDGTFRQDLYYRLNVIPINIPPLRERLSDIEAFCEHFIHIFSQKYNRPFSLTDRQMGFMKQYQWPGNIRELENIIEYLVLCSSGIGTIDDKIITGLLDISLEQETIEAASDFGSAVAQFEKQLIEKALRSSGNLREAGRLLNLNASTISRKIKQYNINYTHIREEKEASKQ